MSAAMVPPTTAMPGGAGSRLLVVGLGRSGVSAARLAARGGAAVRVTDSRGADSLEDALRQLPAGCEQVLGGHPESCLDEVDLVVTSPGVAADAPLLEAARRRSVPILPEVEFAWFHAQDRPLVAVTGSNGKSTVTLLVSELLRCAGITAVAGANLGTPASELVMEGGWDAWVLEISSFQAELLTAMRPRVAVFLNFSQDHLERHNLTGYLAAKQRLFAFQEAGDCAILNADDPAAVGTPTRARRMRFSLAGPSDGWLDGRLLRLGDELLADADNLALGGRHNLANVLAAALATRELGATCSGMAELLARFEGLPHRHRLVHQESGVRWVDDSKATNVGATLAALAGYAAGSVHLILGGDGKGQDFSPLAPEVRRAAARVYLIGADEQGRRDLADALAGAAPTVDCVTLAAAVGAARAAAQPGATVLLAPACASYDQFVNYAERGDAFTRLAQAGEA